MTSTPLARPAELIVNPQRPLLSDRAIWKVRLARVSASPDVRIGLGLLIVTLVFFAPLFLPGPLHRWIVDGDFSQQFFPFRAFEAREWWHGRIPLWNPDMFGGHPFEADVQTAVFYPLAMANAILWGWHGLPYLALEGEVIVHTWLGGVFMYLLARRLTGSRLGGVVAGLAFGLGGFLTTYPAQQLAVLETAIWLPLIVLALHEATERRLSWAWLLGAAVGFGIALLAGHTQTALFMAYAAEGYLAFRILREGIDRRCGLGALVMFPAVAALVAAIQLLPSAQLLQVSTRDAMDYASAAHGYLVSSLPEIFVPLWHGEKALSIGVAALFLAILGAWVSRREALVYWTVVGLVAIPLSTGGATPLFWLLYHFAPGWDLFRDQERVIYLFSFAGALLAGRGAAEVARRLAARRLPRGWIGLAAAGAVVALLLTVATLAEHAPQPLVVNLALDAAILGALALLLGRAANGGRGVEALAERDGARYPARLMPWLLAHRSPLDPAVALAVGIVALIVAEAFALNFGNNLSPVNPDPRPRLASTAAFINAFTEPFRIDATSEAAFPSDYGSMLNLPTVGGNTPFELERMHEMLTPQTGWKLWQILNVKFVIGDPAPTPGLKLVFEDHGLKTYQMQDSLPRAWAVRAVEVAHGPDEVKSLILAPGYHPGNVVVLERPPSIGPFTPGPRPDVKTTYLSPQRIAVDATADGNAMLVLADQYYPGWVATRDGQPIQTFSANYVAMAFELPPGSHHFEIVYRPLAFYAGALLSAMALLGVAAVALTTDRGRKIAMGTREAINAHLMARRPEGGRGQPLERWTFAIVAGLLVVAGFGLRLHALGLPNLTSDEWFMLRNHDEGVAWIVHQARTFEPHPLLYYVGLTGWIELAGRSEFAMRFPSVAFDLLLVPAAIGLGRLALGRRAALFAGALAAVNPYQIVESQNARNYAMVTGLAAVATLLFYRAIRRGGRRDWAAYGVALFLALNTHYDAALVLAGHVAFLVVVGLRAAHRGQLGKLWATQGRYVAGTLGVVGVLFVAMVVYALPGLRAYHGYFPTPVGIDHVFARSLATFSLDANATARQAIPWLALAALGLTWLAARRRDLAAFLGLGVGLPFVLVGVLFLFRPMFDERYLIVLAPAYLVLVAAGLEAFATIAWPLGVGAALVVLALTASWLPRTYGAQLTDRPDYRDLAAWIATDGEPSDPIIATGYAQANLFNYYDRSPQRPVVMDDAGAIPTRLPALLAASRGLWLLPYFHSDADLAALDVLGKSGALVDERWFNNNRALYFVPTDRLTPSPARGRFGDGIDLTAARVTTGTITPGDPVAVALSWKARAPLPTPKLSLRLVDGNGEILAQHDVSLSAGPNLAAGDLDTRVGLFVPPVAPPGTYRLALLLYRPSDGQALPLATAPLDPNNLLSLGSIRVGTRERPVAPTEYGVPATVPVEVAPGLAVLGHDPVPGSLNAGDWLSFRVLWLADRAPLPTLRRTIVFRGGSGQDVASVTAPILPDDPTSDWRLGQALAERVRVQVPPTLPRGAYAIILRASPRGPDVHLGTIAIGAPDRSFAPPPVAEKIGAAFDGFATLFGINRGSAVAARGSLFELTRVWAARGPADRGNTVFVHLVGPDGKLHGQTDRPPLGGSRPTDGWVAGEYLSDAYAPVVALDAPSGTYQVDVGMYDPNGGARVPITLADGTKTDHVVVGTFEVRP